MLSEAEGRDDVYEPGDELPDPASADATWPGPPGAGADDLRVRHHVARDGKGDAADPHVRLPVR